MKAVAFGLAPLAAVVAAVLFLWPAPGRGPVPLRYGVDACGDCRMAISRAGFGGELRDADGHLTTYDDLGCLVRAMLKRHGAMPEAWVEDHAGGGFVPLMAAHLVRSGRADTPMGSGLVAFRDAAAADAFVSERGGERVAFEDLVREPERLVAAGRPGRSR